MHLKTRLLSKESSLSMSVLSALPMYLASHADARRAHHMFFPPRALGAYALEVMLN